MHPTGGKSVARLAKAGVPCPRVGRFAGPCSAGPARAHRARRGRCRRRRLGRRGRGGPVPGGDDRLLAAVVYLPFMSGHPDDGREASDAALEEGLGRSLCSPGLGTRARPAGRRGRERRRSGRSRVIRSLQPPRAAWPTRPCSSTSVRDTRAWWCGSHRSPRPFPTTTLRHRRSCRPSSRRRGSPPSPAVTVDDTSWVGSPFLVMPRVHGDVAGGAPLSIPTSSMRERPRNAPCTTSSWTRWRQCTPWAGRGRVSARGYRGPSSGTRS